MLNLRRLAAIAAACAVTAGASIATAAPAFAIRDDCKTKSSCGWVNANFAGSRFDMNSAGEWVLSSLYKNKISSVYNHSSLWTKWYTSTNYASSGRWCLRSGYQNHDLYGYPQNDNFEAMQMTSDSSGC